jgi:nitrate/TMAO reductase-like tetraheme cytochrome c subunit
LRGEGRWLLVLGLLVAAVGVALQGELDNPHGYMDDEARCADCHQVEPDGEDWILDPHMFTVSVTDTCLSCHPQDQIGRSHPVGSDPRRALRRRDFPEELPFHWSDEERTEVMTCGTCHNPHLPRFSEDKLYTRQEVHPGTADAYLTYFLRIRGTTPRQGFMPLCHACHPDM